MTLLHRASLLTLLLAGCLAIPPAHAQTAIPDTRGPVYNAGMKVIIHDDGVEAPRYIYKDPGAKPAPWTAKWINLANVPPLPNGIQSRANLFRKEITLDQAPTSVTAWLTGGDYRLYINGRMAGRGPADRGRDYTGTSSGRWFYDTLNLTPLFHAGKNVIAVEVSGGPGLLFEADVKTASGDSVIASDDTWHNAACTYLQNVVPPPADKMGTDRMATFDGNEEPVGWQLPGFDDSKWGLAHTVGAPSETLVPSEIPPLMEIHYPIEKILDPHGALTVPDQQPLTPGHPIIVTGDANFSVHFDRIMAGHWGIAVKGSQSARIYLEGTETTSDGGRKWAVVLRNGLQYFESPDYYSVGTIKVAVRGVTSPVEILDVSGDYQSQPVDYQGSFTCSDDYLNQVWKDCRWATQINFQTQHLDSPQHQEPISDYGDYLIEDLAFYNAFGSYPWLARQDLRKWAWIMKNAHYQTFHTSYALLWLQALMNYYDATNDKDLVVEMAPYVHDLMAQFHTYIGKNGILSNAPNYLFMDWVTIDGFQCHHPPAVIGQGYMTAFYYKALADAARVAQLTGDAGQVPAYMQERAQIKEAYNRELWNADQGLYRDGKPFATQVPPNAWLPADKDIETFSGQNNSLAVLYDLAPKEKQQAIMNKVMAMTPWNVRPYFMHFVLCAIAHAGLFDQYGTPWMRKWKIVPETQSFREMGDQGDLSHGWIASPLYQMSTQILGVTPQGLGTGDVTIRPTLCDLSFASGVVPTRHGNVAVAWERNADHLNLNVTVPPQTRAEVILPLGAAKAPLVTLDGRALRVNGNSPAGPSREILPPGTHRFSISGLEIFTPPPPDAAAMPAPAAPGHATVTADGPTSITTETNDAHSLEADVPKKSLVLLGSRDLSGTVETNAQPIGGATHADPIHNGTVLNGSGASVVFTLNTQANPSGYDLTGIRTFAGHSDARASQNYTVSLAYVSAPTDFVPFVNTAVQAGGGGSEIQIQRKGGGILENGKGVKAAQVAAIKFDFKDGPNGFNVYREISITGQPEK